ncbi:MAG: mechanosensitive ion channel family protein [Nonlabens ulvanivorans]|uniref:Potassium efflux system KefA protein n=4 Tax=Nonlabens ulvanivorans TaxID=906888 RepID=A0A081DBU3_NONUL|nr:mechanosensitive ion channel family protein [Nonlabens ulvanivorans]GAK76389.1 potassium efflux system KefA protein /small-conductance mechanosensitive channel [Nonlabens ulvanivorans]GAL74698.1 potassium efflux system KefA protein [Nonlabens ulvanivorans]
MIFQQENTKEVAAAAAEAEAKSNMTTTELILDQLESWYETLITNLPSMAVALIVLIVTYFISKWVSRGVQKLVQHKVNQVSVRKLIGKVAAAVVIVGGLFIALNVLDLNETVQAIIAGAGVSGLVIGLALQGTLSNTLSGVHLSFRKMVSVGDWVETNGYEGEIISIDLNKFIMREADNNTVIIPNKLIMDNPMKNYGLTKTMRVIVHCGVGYESDLDHVREVAKQAIIDNFDQINSKDDVEFYYREFGDSSINFMLRFYYDIENGLQKLINTSEAIIVIKKAFDKEGINIPFPIRTLQFDNQLQMQNVPEQQS